MYLWWVLLFCSTYTATFTIAEKTLVGEHLADSIQLGPLKSIHSEIDKLSLASLNTLGHPTRVAGSAGHEETMKYVITTLNGMLDYYYYRFHDFFIETPKLTGFSLIVSGKAAKSAVPALRSPWAPKVATTMSMVSGTGCRSEDYPTGTRGRGVLLVQDGECTVSIKASLARVVGARGLFVYSIAPNGEPPKAQLDLQGDFAPTFMVSQAEGLEWRDQIRKEGPIRAVFYIQNRAVQTRVRSIIAETRNGDHDNVMMLGAKTNSPGLWTDTLDYTTGLASSLLIAKLLAKYEVTNAIRFAWWTVDGATLSGANDYFRSLPIKENAAIRGYLSLDSLHEPTFPSAQVLDQIDLIGTGNLIEEFATYFRRHNHFFEERPINRTHDYEGVLLHKVPASGFISPSVHIGPIEQNLPHEQNTTIIQNSMWEFASKATAHVLGHFAESLECLPKRLRLLINRPVFVHSCVP